MRLSLLALFLLGACSSAVLDAPAAEPRGPYACAVHHRATPGDSDGDGVPDAIDMCPCQPGPSFAEDPPEVRGCPFDSSPRPSRR